MSGKHDLDRLLQLARHFEVPVAVCINKADINLESAALIEAECQAAGVPVVGRIPFDDAITQAQLVGRSVVEMEYSRAGEALKEIWATTQTLLNETAKGCPQ